MNKYDLIIVGAGPSGIFTAYEYKKLNPNANILMVEKGHSIEKRICPKRKTNKCINCNPCNITTGFSGSGSFSDGKLTAGVPQSKADAIGGDLPNYIGLEKYEEIFKYTDQIYLDFGADKELHGIGNEEALAEIKKQAIQSNLKLVESPVRHLGTEKAYEIYAKLQEHLEKQGVEMLFDTFVEDLIIKEDRIIGVKTKKFDFYSDKVVIGVGREGSNWLKNICNKYNIETSVGIVDIGVRMETSAEITKFLDENTYESKLIYHTDTYDDKVRTFCWNPKGEVAEERYDGDLAVVNGHSYKGDNLKTQNTNFALLVSLNFTEPFKNPIEYGRYIAKLGNMLSGGKVLVQRYGDFKRGRRTTDERLSRNNIVPTLKDAVAGDMGLVLPYRIMLDIVETIEALDKIMPGFAGDGTLIYGVEVKFYSNKVKVKDNFETNIKNLHVLGDGAGITRGLIQASMNGVVFARNL